MAFSLEGYVLFQMTTKKELLRKLPVRAEHDRMLQDGQGHLREHLASVEAVDIQLQPNIVNVIMKKYKILRPRRDVLAPAWSGWE